MTSCVQSVYLTVSELNYLRELLEEDLEVPGDKFVNNRLKSGDLYNKLSGYVSRYERFVKVRTKKE